MRVRTNSEQKAYAEGFDYCCEQFAKILKRKTKEEAVLIMKERADILKKVVRAEKTE